MTGHRHALRPSPLAPRPSPFAPRPSPPALRPPPLAPALALALFLLLPLALPAVGGAERTVYLVRVDDVVTQGSTLRIALAIERAEEEGGVAVVIVLDTPGGLLDATLDIVTTVFAADVPVITFVHPTGGIAASAGTFVLLTGHVAAMAPATTIGTARPIEMNPEGGATAADAKVLNATAEKIREVAAHRDRDADVAEAFVREDLALGPDDALAAGIVDFVARDVGELLAEAHGREVDLDGRLAGGGNATRVVTLDTRGARVVEVTGGVRGFLYDVVGNPQVAFILFLVGLYGVIFGLASPGTLVPETIGAIALLLALFGLGLFDFSTAGVLLLLLGVVFLVADVFAPTHGLLTVAGVVAMTLGALLLPLEEPFLPASWYDEFRVVVLASALTTAGFALFAVRAVLKVRKARPRTTDLRGSRARVVQALEPEGMVRVQGELWKARIAEGVGPEGATVEVVGSDGLTLIVKAVDDAARPGEPD